MSLLAVFSPLIQRGKFWTSWRHAQLFRFLRYFYACACRVIFYEHPFIGNVQAGSRLVSGHRRWEYYIQEIVRDSRSTDLLVNAGLIGALVLVNLASIECREMEWVTIINFCF